MSSDLYKNQQDIIETIQTIVSSISTPLFIRGIYQSAIGNKAEVSINGENFTCTIPTNITSLSSGNLVLVLTPQNDASERYIIAKLS